MKALLDVLEGLRTKDHKDCVLVMITAADGSTPGRIGAMMVVTEEGRRFGTIGGGAVELKSIESAKRLLTEKRSCLERFRLHQNEIADIGMICGGENDVFFRYISEEDEEAAAVIGRSLEMIRLGEPFWLITELSENGTFSIFTGKEETPDLQKELTEELDNVPQCRQVGGKSCFCMPMTDTGKVYLFGAGHISQALAPLLAKLDFACGVYDDREEFLKQDCFEGIDTVLIDPADISALTEKITAADYICIMTHGHKDDFEIQRQVMKTPARYIGVIGSARKQKAAREKLIAMGYTEEDFRNVVSPIGLNIGANSPQEIAVCIAAQLIMVRSGRGFGERDWKR